VCEKRRRENGLNGGATHLGGALLGAGALLAAEARFATGAAAAALTAGSCGAQRVGLRRRRLLPLAAHRCWCCLLARA
jgi:hypothetical protein